MASGPEVVTAHRRGRDRGFTLVEILVAIVLVGILSAVVVVGVGSLTSQGSAAGCNASKDATRTAANTYWASTGAYPTTLTAMTATTPATLTLPSGTSLDASGLVLTGSGWTLTMSPGAAGGPPSLLCSTEVPAGYTAGPNGHFYKYVVGAGLTQASAIAAAATVTFNGQTGYLATITSAAEQAVITALVGGNSAWISGTDVAVEGVWRFNSGPESGQQFSNGNQSVSGSYVKWALGQPDNAGGENCLHMYVAWPNQWNDVPCGWTLNNGYVVEIG
jgi:prepilin-type N-terminal cleavage/methylation domain-containing protein